MSRIILTSSPSFTKTSENGKKVAVRLNNKEFISVLKKGIKNDENVLFICSDPDNYKESEEWASLIEKSLSLSGIKFKMSDILDSRNWLFSRSLVKNSDLVVIMGGNPLMQMEFFDSIELKDKIKNSNGCILSISTGTVNMANNVYCSKDENNETAYYKGLGLFNYSVEPHFNASDTKRLNEVLLEDSKKQSFIALEDDSYIVINDKESKIYGNAYYFKDGSYKKINSLKGIENS